MRLFKQRKLNLQLLGFILKSLIGDYLIDQRSLLWFLLKALVDDVHEVLVHRHGKSGELLLENLLLESLWVTSLEGLLLSAELVKNDTQGPDI